MRETARREPVKAGDASHMAGSHDTLWVGDDSSFPYRIHRVDPETARTIDTLRLGYDAYPSGIAADARSVWVADSTSHRVLKLDPATGRRPGAAIAVGEEPQALAINGDDLWVANYGEDTVSRIDIRTRRVVKTTRVADSPTRLVATSDGVWVAHEFEEQMLRIDRRSGRVGARLSVGGGGSSLLAVEDAAVWTSEGFEGGLIRVGPDEY